MNITLGALAAFTSSTVKNTGLGIGDRTTWYPTMGNAFYFRENAHFYNNVKQLKKKEKKKVDLL